MRIQGPIVVIGFKGSGKSLIGEKLAGRLGLRFVDSDSLIETIYKDREGEALSFREIYRKLGRERFMEMEREAVAAALSEKDRVISLGGGTLMNTGGIDMKESGATFVYLTVDKDTLFERILTGGTPAFVDKDDPRRSLAEYYEKRLPVYEKYADITVDNTNRTPDEVVDEILKALETLPREEKNS